MAKTQPSGAAMVAQARSWLGVPYLYGGTTRQGVDCSGLVMECAHAIGISACPRTSEEQWAWCEHINASEAGAGDLVFFVGAELDPPPGHVGIIVSPGQMIDAPYTGAVVRQENYSTSGSGVMRIIGYGRLRGVAKSNSANPYYGTTPKKADTDIMAVAGSVVMVVMAVVLIGAAFLAIIGAGLLFH